MSATSTVRTLTFRKTRSGKWVVFGPADKIEGRTVVTVRRKDGTTTTVQLEGTGRHFDVDGVECCYGYIVPDRRHGGHQPRSIYRRSHRTGRGSCENCQEGPALHIASDSSGLVGKVCSTCRNDPMGISFA